MDVVYVIKDWTWRYDELRYSLRSLCNVPHDNVIIVWHKPSWLKWVKHIKIADDTNNKINNVRKKLEWICKSNRISEDFIYMHDDIFVLQPQKEIKYYKMASLANHKNTILRKLWFNRYYIAINSVYELFPKGDSFDVHCPIVFNRKKLWDVLEKYKYSKWSRRSIYCNEYGIKWEFLPNTYRSSILYDCKIFDPKKFMVTKTQPYLSISDLVAYCEPFKKFIQAKFPDKSPYEK